MHDVGASETSLEEVWICDRRPEAGEKQKQKCRQEQQVNLHVPRIRN